MTTDTTMHTEDIDCRQSLLPCANKPNCVSSLASSDSRYFVEPLLLGDDPDRDWQLLTDLLSTLPGMHIVSRQQHYCHVECRSRLFGFIDDLEFCRSHSDKLCHVRSASRSGYYDFKVNRKRVEKIRKAFVVSV